MTQDNYLLNIFEKVCRSNIYLFIFSRYFVGKFLSKIVSEIEVDNYKNIIIRPQISKQKIIFGYPDDLVNKFKKIANFKKKIHDALSN